MKTFALLVYPANIKQLKNFWPITRIMPGFLRQSWLKNNPPFKIVRIKEEIPGYLIALPLLPQQMLALGEEFILDKIVAAGHLAEELGASILGLSGLNSLVLDKNNTMSKKLKIPVACGNAFTAWSVYEAIYRMAKAKKIDLKKSTLAVIGATNPTGSLCARKLSGCVNKIILSARERDKLERLKENILHLNPIEIIIEEDAHKAAREADIVVITAFEEAVNEFKPNAIVCDISISRNLKFDPNINFIQGGLIKLPYPSDLAKRMGLAKDIIYASMAETILLASEERLVSNALGESINLDRLEEIADIATQHGFEVWVPEAPML